MYDAVIGFSINLEDVWVLRGDLEKQRKIRSDLKVMVSGTSLDVARQMALLEKKVKLFGFVGPNDPSNLILEQKLQGEQFESALLPVRQGSARAAILIGLKRYTLSYKPVLRSVPRKELGGQEARFLVVTGLRHDPKEIKAALCLWNQGEGVTVLNANVDLTSDRKLFWSILNSVDILCLNDLEATSFLRKKRQDIALQDLRVFHRSGVKIALVTCAERGAFLSFSRGIKIHQKALRLIRPFVDETGAGDAFLGAFLSALIEGQDPKEALRFAAAAGAGAVTHYGGSSLPTRQEIRRILKFNQEG